MKTTPTPSSKGEKKIAIRIQRKRTKGWKMPSNSVYVGRPTKWGNPYKVGAPFNMSIAGGGYDGKTKGFVFDADSAVLFYKINLSIELEMQAEKELKGKNLVCFCPLDKPCHADVLLKIANKL